ncbi:MAG: hypothetical protein K9G67_03415 [Bacteroidales bacterium]|nr:hypothetical protein [Bacteroidales bacterium]MCF8350832.1 hypothetical protein [Bacteroidales bacterium]MCF8375379.1 hypothetical protein [Bacteroidales bacterium]MCF8401282.1 hypothetical protein [Bacteroidales bacterium]
MMISNKGNAELESTGLLAFVYKWRIPLLIVGLITIICAFIFSSPAFITPLYKSSVILFPTSTNSISKALLTENASAEKDVMEFGEDEQTERMLQILNSNRIRDKIVSKYNLMEHYEIDTASPYKNTNLYKEYESNVNFRRTEYMAIKISVYDRDASYAANIANDIAALVDSTINEIQHERAERALNIVEGEYVKFRNEINQLQDSLKKLMSNGVHDYESQAEMINRQLAIELAKGNMAAVRRLENKLEQLSEFGGAYLTLTNALEYDVEQFSLIKAKYKEAKVDAEEILPQKFIVNKAYKAERKSYPIRWLIVVVSTFSTMLFTLIIILIAENIGKLRKQIRTEK